MAAQGHLEIKVSGAEAVEQKALKLRPDAIAAMRKEQKRLAKNLAAKMRRRVISNTKVSRQTSPAGRLRGHSSGRPMGARVRPTIRQVGEHVIAGPHPMLFGTEYGMNAKSGWYAYPEHASNPSLQYFRHQSDGYWFRPTYLHAQPEMDEAVQRVADETARDWS